MRMRYQELLIAIIRTMLQSSGLMLYLFLAACQPVALSSEAVLRQVDDYPFYELHYDADYDFDAYLERGINRVPQASGSAPFGCTVFAALGDSGTPLLGRNFDWNQDPMLILFTDPPDGYASVSMVDIAYLGYDRDDTLSLKDKALQDAPYLPFDGMNEHGLAVGMMAVSHSDGGDDPEKVTIDSLSAIRLLLDYARTLDEAVALLADYNVAWGNGPPLHYLVADAAGKSAVIEYIDGEMHVLPAEKPWHVATNFLLDGVDPLDGRLYCNRYRQAYDILDAAGGSTNPHTALELLEDVSQKSTLWSVIYHLGSGEVWVVIDKDFEQVYSFQLAPR
jgi:hypothetical protein